MTKKEKQRLLKLCDDAERIWRGAEYIDGEWALVEECPICEDAPYCDACTGCLVVKATGESCFDAVNKAAETHSRRPIFDLIRKIRKWVEVQ